MVGEWSIERKPGQVNSKIFSTKYTITLNMQTKAYNWKRYKPDIKIRTGGGTAQYFISASDQPKLSEKEINKYLRQLDSFGWKRFYNYVKERNRLWKRPLHCSCNSKECSTGRKKETW